MIKEAILVVGDAAVWTVRQQWTMTTVVEMGKGSNVLLILILVILAVLWNMVEWWNMAEHGGMVEYSGTWWKRHGLSNSLNIVRFYKRFR